MVSATVSVSHLIVGGLRRLVPTAVGSDEGPATGANSVSGRAISGHPLLSGIVRARRLKLFGHVARADKSQDHSRALRARIWHSPKN